MAEYHWQDYIPIRVGKLCYHYCTGHSHLPIRDVLNDHYEGFKSELNYETATYNFYGQCNQLSIHAAVEDKLSHILFVTKYTGSLDEYRGRYFIVGYYEIGWTTNIEQRTAIRAKKMCFVPIEKAYEITDERWRLINTGGVTTHLDNLRYATQRIVDPLLSEIIGHLDKSNIIDDYWREVARLKAQHNPFEGQEIPDGRIFIINVGANASSPLQSLLFVDNRFEFVPIPEQRYKTDRDCLTYGTLRQFYEPTKPLLDLFQKSPVSPELKVHSDPEFLTLTYGDNIKKKTNLQRLQRGDFLFFLARLVPFNNGQFNHSKANFALIGYLQIEEILKESHSSIFDSPVFNQSVHFGRWKADESSFDNFAIFKGSTRSLRFYFAVPFNRRLVELVPILKADNSHWDWKRTTELGTIGANTRAARMHIDPNVNKERAQRFWQHIYNAQKWSSGRHNSKPCG